MASSFLAPIPSNLSTTMEVKDQVNASIPTNTELQDCEAPLLIAASVNNVWRSTTLEEACPSPQLGS
ncbi:hypothetical protein ACFX11_035460 [Malus domestica]